MAHDTAGTLLYRMPDFKLGAEIFPRKYSQLVYRNQATLYMEMRRLQAAMLPDFHCSALLCVSSWDV